MILVTGGTGLVGGHLLWHLLQQNERIKAIRRSTSDLKPLRAIFSTYTSAPDVFLSRIDWKIGDVLNVDSIKVAMLNVTMVYHCAAVVSIGNNIDILSDTNVAGTRNMVQTALENNIEKFCFVSSIAACGRTLYGKQIDETDIWTDSQDRSLYSRSKYYSEQEVWKGIRQGLNAVIVIPGVILGVSGNNTGSSQLFALVQKGLIFYTNGGTGYVCIKDVVKAMVQLMKSEVSGEGFILVGENCSNKEILSWMADGFGNRRPFIGIGKSLLCLVGLMSELFGKLFCFRPLIDRGTARTATHREYYSNLKIKIALDFSFTPVKQCIGEVCEYRMTEKKRMSKH